MSGVVGIINLGGAPVDAELLRRMTDSMTFRGPDAQEVWVDGNVGFGHTMLRTTWEAETEKQPLTLDGRVWLTADARIDGRAELISELEIKLRTKLRIPERSNVNGSDSITPNDAELILYAYHAWGEDCVKHLIGDFAFAIWDGRERRLFCVRDQFGVKPFYYARVANCFVFSNTLNCVRLHPAVSAKLNDVAIGDFLLWGENQEPTTTAFADIARLPGANALAISASDRCVRRYWSLPTDFHLNYKDSRDYPEQFRTLLSQSVEDRLRTDRVALEVSGGLDSTSVAATAKGLMANRPDDAMKAFCVSYERLIPDQEKRYADIAAAAIGLPIEHIIGDDFPLFEEDVVKPEPFHVYPLSAISTEVLKRMAAHSRVALTGWDGDTWMSETPKHYFRFLLKCGQLGRLASAMSWYVKSQRAPPPVGVRTTLMRLRGKYPVRPPYPVWLDPEFEARAGLRGRWNQLNAEPPPAHQTRPYAFRVLSSPSWACLFEQYDAGLTGVAIEERHPLTDIRVIKFLLQLPPVPWCVKKEIIRSAMRGILPPEILRRPKTTLAGDPVALLLNNGCAGRAKTEASKLQVGTYVNRAAVAGISNKADGNEQWMNLRPLFLELWSERTGLTFR